MPIAGLRAWPLPAGLALVLLLLSARAAADYWYIAPKASLDTFYDDNVRLSAVAPQSAFGVTGRAEASLGRTTEVSEVAINGGISTRRYGEVSELDGTDGFLGLATTYQLERNRIGLAARMDYDSTLTSEVATSGFVQVNKRRTSLFVKPSWSYSLSERARLELGASYTDVSYQDVELIPLYDYTLAGLSLDGTFLWSERAQLFGRLTYDQYEADQVGVRSDSIGLLAGSAYSFSESLSLTALVGVRHTNAETRSFFGGTTDESSTGPLLDVSLEKRFEVGRLRLTASQALTPSGSGDLVNTSSAGVTLDYPLTARWKLVVNAEAYRNRNPGGDEDINDRDYFSFVPRLRRKLSEWWQLDLGYRFRHQKYSVREDDASSNAVFLTLRYTWPTEPLAQWSFLR